VRGYRGATGPRGFKGARGQPGRDGANGKDGQPGPPGVQGNRGTVGPRGLSGQGGGGGGVDASKLQEFYGEVRGVVRRASDAAFVSGATVRLMADKKVGGSVSAAMHMHAAGTRMSAHLLGRFCAPSSLRPTVASPCLRLGVATCCRSPAYRPCPEWISLSPLKY
jgi:hypothetical protein